jgi:hypothetical protein
MFGQAVLSSDGHPVGPRDHSGRWCNSQMKTTILRHDSAQQGGPPADLFRMPDRGGLGGPGYPAGIRCAGLSVTNARRAAQQRSVQHVRLQSA